MFTRDYHATFQFYCVYAHARRADQPFCHRQTLSPNRDSNHQQPIWQPLFAPHPLCDISSFVGFLTGPGQSSVVPIAECVGLLLPARLWGLCMLLRLCVDGAHYLVCCGCGWCWCPSPAPSQAHALARDAVSCRCTPRRRDGIEARSIHWAPLMGRVGEKRWGRNGLSLRVTLPTFKRMPGPCPHLNTVPILTLVVPDSLTRRSAAAQFHGRAESSSRPKPVHRCQVPIGSVRGAAPGRCDCDAVLCAASSPPPP